MRQKLPRITTFLLVVAVVVSGLAGCTRQADERGTEATESPAETQVVEVPAGADVTPASGVDVTPAPGTTQLAAVTSTPEESSALTQVPPQQPTEQASAGAAPTAATEASAAATPVAEPEEASETEVHVVVEGETLTAIAARYSTSVSTLQELNDIEDPESIQAGQEIKIPVEDGSSASPTRSPDCRYVHKVREGETAFGIAERYGVKLRDIVRVNEGIKDPSRIYPSMTLCIP